MIKFYYAPQSSATRCHIALEEIGVPYEKVRIHLDKNDQKKPEFLAINPNGKIPALVDGDVKLFESLAILLHLGSRYGAAKGVWPKAGTPEEGDALSWTVWASTEMSPPLFDVVMNACDFPWTHPKEHKSAYIAEAGGKRFASCVQILDKKLAGHDFLIGKSFTIADVAVAMTVAMGTMFAGLKIDSKNVTDWVARVQSRPSVQKAFSEQ